MALLTTRRNFESPKNFLRMAVKVIFAGYECSSKVNIL